MMALIVSARDPACTKGLIDAQERIPIVNEKAYLWRQENHEMQKILCWLLAQRGWETAFSIL